MNLETHMIEITVCSNRGASKFWDLTQVQNIGNRRRPIAVLAPNMTQCENRVSNFVLDKEWKLGQDSK